VRGFVVGEEYLYYRRGLATDRGAFWI